MGFANATPPRDDELLPMFSKKSSIYLDHAAATPMAPAVFDAMKPWLTEEFGNPSALYASGVRAADAIETARKQVAEGLFAQPDTIIFTGSGTESANMAIFGVATGSQPGHIITTQIEHKAVLEPIKQLEKQGWDVTYLEPDVVGMITAKQVAAAIKENTRLVSIMYANNEIGTVLPIAEIGREVLKWRKANNTTFPYFHTDACQAGPYLDLHAERLHVDLLSLNGSKLYGPKGVGVLYRRRDLKLSPMMLGGGQEFGLRPGTENVAGVVGFAKAFSLVRDDWEKKSEEIAKLRDWFWKKLSKAVPGVQLNGPEISKESVNRLPNNLHVTFPGADAEACILYLDAQGLQCSSGSACTSDSDDVSHVMKAIRKADQATSSIRFSIGKETSKKQLRQAVKLIADVVDRLRVIETKST